MQTSIFKDHTSISLIDKQIPVKGAISQLSIIDDEVYASASGGEVFKRINNNKWEEITRATTGRFFSNSKFTQGFQCIDGFSADEIYAGGEKGALWLMEQGNWRPVELPTNSNISQIVCAPDGHVYLVCRHSLLKGRKDTWQRMNIPKSFNWQHPIEKIAWFENGLYILPIYASALGMAVYRDDQFETVNVGSFFINPDKIINYNPLFGIETKNSDSNVFIPGGMNDMVANDDLLMITGNDEVILFNGERWFNLFDKDKTEEELRATGTFYDPREL